ncbi:MAG: hypothetical protein DRJ66_01420 [Thermoprotei archaeon]|nr:MAG: hypothetical protein DRJ66_01420 [Thermoprotei archaeon]
MLLLLLITLATPYGVLLVQSKIMSLAELKVLRVAIPPYFNKVNPFDCRTWLEWLLCNLVYDTITKPTPPLYYVFMVNLWSLSSMKNNENYTQWTLVLRDNLTWSDGIKVTANDLAFTISFVSKIPPWSSMLKALSKITILNDTAIRVEFSKPVPYLLRLLSSTPLLRSDILGNRSIQDILYFNITAGPYVIDLMIPNEIIVLERNPYYFLKSRIIYDKIELVAYPDSESAFEAFSRGEVQGVIGFVSKEFIASNLLRDDIAFAFLPTLAIYAVVMNNEKAPLSDMTLRSIIRSLIDAYNISYILLDAFVENQLLKVSKNTLVYTFIPIMLISPQYGAFSQYVKAHEDAGISYKVITPLVARSLLQESNYTDLDNDGFLEWNGMPINLTFLAPLGDPIIEATAKHIAHALNSSGIMTKLILLPPHTLYKCVYVYHDFDLALIEIPYYIISNPIIVALLVNSSANMMPIIPNDIRQSRVVQNLDSIIFVKELNTTALLEIERMIHRSCVFVPLFQRNSLEVFYVKSLPIKTLRSYLSLLLPENTLLSAPIEHRRYGTKRYILLATNVAMLVVITVIGKRGKQLYSPEYEPYP